MAKSTSVCNSILALIFNGTAWADIAENDSSVPLSNLYLSLHTADPGVGGLQTTNEATYTGYARLAVVRTTSGWAVPSSGSTSNAALAQFIICSGGSNTITHVAIGKADSGAGLVLYAGALSSPRSVSDGIQPQFAIGALVVTES
jgi:hypothetical protein